MATITLTVYEILNLCQFAGIGVTVKNLNPDEMHKSYRLHQTDAGVMVARQEEQEPGSELVRDDHLTEFGL